MQLALALPPEQGALIPGGGGLRKWRWGAEGRGKRGGVRTIYYWAIDDDRCYMLYMYARRTNKGISPPHSSVRSRAWCGRSSNEGSRV